MKAGVPSASPLLQAVNSGRGRNIWRRGRHGKAKTLRHQISSDTGIAFMQGEPVAALTDWLQIRTDSEELLLVEFNFQPWWLDDAQPTPLTAIYLAVAGELACTVTDAQLEGSGVPPVQQYQHWLEQHNLLSVKQGQPIPLQPTYIPKPWGREIWFTGVEERGVCHFGRGDVSVPIPWLQAVLPGNRCGKSAEPLVLLKVLDPSAEEVTGDLYFELHEKKREVYVVTHVDRNAWPDGTGYIRYGFSASKLEQIGSESEFRQAYRAAVADYERVRREIDALPEGQSASSPLQALELNLRSEMESFTHLRPLHVGDVVVVPLRMPHSLQHGVRTIEFQTPVYERKILSFAQRVLTQGHWDTESAVAMMRLQPPGPEAFACLQDADGVRVERIVDFEDFEVRRVIIEGHAQYALPDLPTYALVMVVEGQLILDELVYGAEEAFLLPADAGTLMLSQEAPQPLVMLLALPRS